MDDGGFKNINICVVGLGVVGGSFAMALRELNPKGLFGVDRDENTLRTAEKRGIIDRGYIDASEPLKISDLVIICIYPMQIPIFVEQYRDSFKNGAIVTDTAGVKSKIVKKICEVLPPDIDFIFGHPMAGREKKGIDYASNEVFKGANYIITPVEGNKEENIIFLECLVKSIGFKRVTRISCAGHDEMISYTSQLPHAIAVALINSDGYDERTGLFIGDSFRDLTRIARINEELWTELFFENSENLVKQIDMFEKRLSEIRNAVLKKDKDTLVENFTRAGVRREGIS